VSNITNIIPCNDFSHVADESKKEIVCGLILGYDEHGFLCVYGGGLIGGKQPTCKDWLWMVRSFEFDLMKGGAL
jgi:hypothetical protein